MCIVSGFFVCFMLAWCWSSLSWDDSFSLNEYWFHLDYNWSVDLERVLLKTDDLDEIEDLYQEVWDDLEYRDSLLVAEKYSQGFWANVFADDNLETLENKWLTLSNVKKSQIIVNKYWKNIWAVLVEYEITEWLVDNIPLLYVSQLFIPKDNYMILISYITENKSASSSASDMFKNIR